MPKDKPQSKLLNKTFDYKGMEYKVVEENKREIISENEQGHRLSWPIEVLKIAKQLYAETKV